MDTDTANCTEQRIKFGQGETDDLSVDKAQLVLMHVREHAPQAFANAMMDAFGLSFRATKPQANRRS